MLSDEVMQHLLESFREEMEGYRDLIRQSLESLRQNGWSQDCLAAPLRAAHNLKGAATSIGLESMAMVTHRLEGLLLDFQFRRRAPWPAAAALAERALEMIGQLFEGEDREAAESLGREVEVCLAEGPPPTPAQGTDPRADLEEALSSEIVSELLGSFREELEEYLNLIHASLQGLEQSGWSADLLQDALRSAHNLKGAASAIGFDAIALATHSLESLLEAVHHRKREPAGTVMELAYGAVQLVGELLERPAPDQVEQLRKEIERCLSDGGGSAASPAPPAPPSLAPAPAPAPPSPSPEEPPPTRLSSGPPAGVETRAQADSVRVPLDKLDTLLAGVHDLMLARQRAVRMSESVEEMADALRRHLRRPPSDLAASRQLLRELEQMTGRLERAARGDSLRLELALGAVRKQAQGLRMVPVQTLLDPLQRQAHDVARRTGKSIRLLCSGGQVEVDRQVLEALKEPLGHLLRNAIDHGVEPPEVRLRAQKDPVGTLRVDASLENNQLCLTVRDDGSGIHLDRVRARAEKVGLEVPDDEEQVMDLLFRPGFSTREKVTETSGRGVGLDVVRLNVEKIGGRVEVASQVGEGTTFRLRLPLHLSTMRVVTFSCGEEMYALPIANLVRAVRVGRELASIAGCPAVKIDDSLVPTVHLRTLLGCPSSSAPEEVGLLIDAGKRLVILVDELWEEQEIVVQPLGPLLDDLRTYNGGSITSDNRVMLVLSPSGLLDVPTVAAASPAEGPGQVARILVVDDSITTRTLQRSVLESAGHSVTVACDGVEALGLLHTRPFDLVITDVDMPGMSGLELVRRIKAAPALAETPTVVVTSRATAEDRLRGAEAGADAYVTKGNFQQADFLDVVESLL